MKCNLIPGLPPTQLDVDQTQGKNSNNHHHPLARRTFESLRAPLFLRHDPKLQPILCDPFFFFFLWTNCRGKFRFNRAFRGTRARENGNFIERLRCFRYFDAELNFPTWTFPYCPTSFLIC